MLWQSGKQKKSLCGVLAVLLLGLLMPSAASGANCPTSQAYTVKECCAADSYCIDNYGVGSPASINYAKYDCTGCQIEDSCGNSYTCKPSCADFCSDEDAQCGLVTDKRSAKMIASGCKPCAIYHGTANNEEEDPTPLECRQNLGEPGCPLKLGNPINLAMANKFQKETDFSVPARGGSGRLSFKRSYNSLTGNDRFDFHSMPLGYYWIHSYYMFLETSTEGADTFIDVWDWTGKTFKFKDLGDGSFEKLHGTRHSLSRDQTTGAYTLTKTDRLRYVFDQVGSGVWLKSILNTRGKALLLSYDNETNQLAEVLDVATGRTITIQYDADTGWISQVLDPAGNPYTYGYGDDGNLISLIYPDQNQRLYSYDEFNDDPHLLTNIVNVAGGMTETYATWRYDSTGRAYSFNYGDEDSTEGRIDLEIYTDLSDGEVVATKASGATAVYRRKIINGVSVVTEVGGAGCTSCTGTNNARYAYDNNLNVTAITGTFGSARFFDFDPWGNAGTETETSETGTITTTYSYDPVLNKLENKVEESVDTPGKKKATSWSYDVDGNLFSYSESGYKNGVQITATTSYTYHADGNLETTDGPRPGSDDLVSYTYFTTGDLESITYPNDGQITYGSYDLNGNPGTMTDMNGNVTYYCYDSQNRMTAMATCSAPPGCADFTGCSSVTQYEYNGASDKVSRIVLPEGNEMVMDYSGNKIRQITDGEGNYYERSQAYDGQSDPPKVVTESIYATGETIPAKTTIQEYDGDGRLLRIKKPKPDYPGYYYETEYGYSTSNKPDTVEDGRGYTTTFEYFYRGLQPKLLQKVIQPGERDTRYGYDKHENLISVTDAEGAVTTYGYDDLGRLLQIVSPDTGTTTYDYDEAGNLIAKVEWGKDGQNPISTTYVYDGMNRLDLVQFPNDPAIDYTYDEPDASNGVGRLTTITDASGQTRYSYDALGRVASSSSTIDGSVYTTAYAYNKNGTLTDIYYHNDRSAHYRIDPDTQRPCEVQRGRDCTGCHVVAANIEYEPFGPAKAMTYGNNMSLQKTFDQNYWLRELQSGNVLSRSYTYDGNGNITGIERNSSTYDHEPALEDLYGDSLTAQYNYMSQAGNLHIEIINPAPLLTHARYEHDTYGNVVVRKLYTPAGDLLQELRLSYNDQHRLVEVQDISDEQNPVTIARYTYNALGQRVKKFLPQTGESVIFLYGLGGNLLSEIRSDGTSTNYIYLENERIARIDSSGSTDTCYYYHNDHLGTPIALTDQNGAVVWNAAYTPFGQALVTTAAVKNNFRFPGQYYDEETGLHYNYFRYYDPVVGRYLRADPIGLDGGINLFSYIANNPLGYADPYGLYVVCVGGGAYASKLSILDQIILGGGGSFKYCWDDKGNSGWVVCGSGMAGLGKGFVGGVEVTFTWLETLCQFLDATGFGATGVYANGLGVAITTSDTNVKNQLITDVVIGVGKGKWGGGVTRGKCRMIKQISESDDCEYKCE
ncbi:RHS repeat-associated core domain-containing protein [Thermodesulfobacteriota bacterium]